MRERYRVLYSPYGAAELKRVYQRNQIIGSLSSVGLVAFLLLVYSLWPAPPAHAGTGGGGFMLPLQPRDPERTTGPYMDYLQN